MFINKYMIGKKTKEEKESFLIKQNSSNNFLLLFSNIKGNIKLLKSSIDYINQYYDVINVFSQQLNTLNINFMREKENDSSSETNSPIFHLGKIIKEIIKFQINNLLNIAKNKQAFTDITNEFSKLIKIFNGFQYIIEDSSPNQNKPNATIQPVLISLMEGYSDIEIKIIDQYINKKYNKSVLGERGVILEQKIDEVRFLEKTFLEFEESSKKNFFNSYQEIAQKVFDSFNNIKNQMKNLSEIISKQNSINLYKIQNEIDFIGKNSQIKEDEKTKNSNTNFSQKHEDLFKYKIKIIMMPKIAVTDNNDNKGDQRSFTVMIPSIRMGNKDEKKKSKLSFFKMFNKEKDNENIKQEKIMEEKMNEELKLKDEDVYNIVKTLYNFNFKLIDNSKYILDVEKEKIEVRKLGEKLLSINLKDNKEEEISDSEVEHLISLLNKKENIYKFFLILNNYRTKGQYEMKERLFNILIDIFKHVIDYLIKSKNRETENLIIILSQTFYLIEEKERIYILEKIKTHPLFHSKEFWERQIKTCIEDHIERSKREMKRINLHFTEMEKQKRLDEIILSQFVPISTHMKNFGVSNDIILDIANQIFELYKTGDETKKLIFTLLKN